MEENNISIVIVEPINPDNISAICRIMKNFNFKNLILINPKFKKEDLRYEIARNGYDICKNAIIKKSFESIKDHFLLISTSSKPGKNITRSYLKLKELEKILEEKLNMEDLKTKNKKIALIFGREDKGLLQKELEESDFIITIETSKEQRALNLSHSVGIILHYFYEFIIPKIKKGKKVNENNIKNNVAQKRISFADKKEKEFAIKKILELYTYFSKKNKTYKKTKYETQKIVWNRILGKSLINKKELKTVLGFLKEIEKSIKLKEKK